MQLADYLRGMGPGAPRDAFVALTGTSLQYLRHVAAGRKKPCVELCAAIERASLGKVRCEELRPDVDWVYLSKRIEWSW